MGFSLGTAEGRIVVDGSGAAKGFQVAEAAANSMFNVVKGKLDSVEELGTKLTKIGTVGAAGFGLAVATAANFEERMSAVQAVSGATADEFDALRQKALDLGKDTAYGATDAASAIEELVKAGLSIPDVMNGAADATVNLAAAGEIALPQAAEIAANAMNNFNLAGEDMPRIADLIAGAANASAISVSEFGQSMSQVGSVANLTGMDFEDVAVAIAEMGNAGIKGSDAGTSLKTMLMNLQPATEAQANEFERLGLLSFNAESAMKAMRENGIEPMGSSMDQIRQAVGAYLVETEGLTEDTKELGKATDDWLMRNGGMQNAFFDTEGKVKSLAEIQEVLKNSTQDMTEQQKLASLEILFGADAIRAAAVLSKEGAAGYDELMASMSKVTAAEVAATRMNNFKGALEQLKGAFETVAIEVGSVLLPILTKIVQGIDTLVGKFLDLPEPIKKAIYIIAAIVTALTLLSGALIAAAFAVVPMIVAFLGALALKSVLSIFGAFFLSLASGLGPIAAISAAWARFMVVLSRFGKIVKVLRVAFTVLRVGLSVLGLAFSWPVAAVLALIAVFVLAYKKIEAFRNFIDGIGQAIIGFLQPAIDWLKNTWNTAIAAVTEFIGEEVQKWVSWFQDIQPLLQGAVGNINGILTGVWDGVKEAATAVWDFIGPYVLGILSGIQAGLEVFRDIVNAIWQPIWDSIKTIVINTWEQIKNYISGVGEVIRGLITAFLQVLNGDWEGAWDTLKETAEQAWERIKEAVSLGVDNVTTVLSNLKDAVNDAATIAWEAIKSAADTTWDAIVEGAKDVPGLVEEGLSDLKGVLVDAGSDMLDGLAEGLASGSGAVWDFLKDLPENAVEAVGDASTWLVEKGGDVIAGLIDGAVEAFNDYIDWLTDIGQNTRDAIDDATQWLREDGKDIIVGLLEGAAEKIGELWEFIKDIPGKVKENVDDATAWLREDGADMVMGLIQGAYDKGFELGQWAAQLPGKILEFVGDAKTWLFEKGKDIVQGVLDGLEEKMEELRNFFILLPGRVAEWVGDTTTWLRNEGISLITGFINGMGSKIWEIGQTILGLPGMIAGWAVGAINWFFDGGYQTILGFINGLIAGAIEVGKWIVFELPTKIRGWASTAIEWLFDGGFQTILGYIAGMKEGFIYIAIALLAIPLIIVAALAAIPILAGFLGGALIIGFVQGIREEIGRSVGPAMEELQRTVENGATAVKIGLKAKWDEMKADISTKFSEMATTAGTGMFNVRNAIFQKLLEMIASAKLKWQEFTENARFEMSLLPGKVMAAISGLPGQIFSWALGVMLSMLNGLGSGEGQVMGAIRSIPGKIVSALGNPSGLLYGIGQTIIGGLVRGINSAVGGVRSALQRVTALIPSWKGPENVDRKLLRGAGKMIMEGLVRGIDLGTPALKKQLNSLMPMMQSAVSLEGNYRPTETRVTVTAPVDSKANGATFQFNAYGNDAHEASDKAVRRVRAMVAMGAF